MKRTGAALTALVLTASLSGCGSSKTGDALICDVLYNPTEYSDVEDLPTLLSTAANEGENERLHEVVVEMLYGMNVGDTAHVNEWAELGIYPCQNLGIFE